MNRLPVYCCSEIIPYLSASDQNNLKKALRNNPALQKLWEQASEEGVNRELWNATREEGSFLQKISRAHLTWNLIRIKDLAIKTLHQGRGILTHQEMQGIHKKHITIADINPLAEKISIKRARILISFFNYLANLQEQGVPLIPELKDFRDNLSNDLSPREQASEIRAWLKTSVNQAYLANKEIPLDRPYLRATLLPLESLAFTNPATLSYIYETQAAMGNLETLGAIHQNPDLFPHILPNFLGRAFQMAAYRGHTEVVRAIIDSERANDIPAEDLGRAFQMAADNAHTEGVQAIIASERVTDISEDHLDRAFYWATSNGHTGIVRAIIASERFNDISEDHLDRAFYRATSNGHTGVVRAMLMTPKILKALDLITLIELTIHTPKNVSRKILLQALANRPEWSRLMGVGVAALAVYFARYR
jgi:hypothetical protein